MRDAIAHLNYVSVFVVAVVGFLLGWLWYSVLFGKAYVAEMKITPEQMAEARAKGMAGSFVKSFLLTLLGTIGLAVVLRAYGAPNWKHGAAEGAFIGACIVAARLWNGGVWERKSTKLQLINGGHEIVLFALQGAIFACWH
jgi:hypothetical protein